MKIAKYLFMWMSLVLCLYIYVLPIISETVEYEICSRRSDCPICHDCSIRSGICLAVDIFTDPFRDCSIFCETPMFCGEHQTCVFSEPPLCVCDWRTGLCSVTHQEQKRQSEHDHDHDHDHGNETIKFYGIYVGLGLICIILSIGLMLLLSVFHRRDHKSMTTDYVEMVQTREIQSRVTEPLYNEI